MYLYSKYLHGTYKEMIYKLIFVQAIGNRLEDMLNEDRKHIDTVVNLVNDPDGQRELLQQDEEEDFLDEGTLSFCINKF